MSDARTRALEREGDTPAALTARLRDGSLTRDRLELAAYCGHAGAREVLPWPYDCPACDGSGCFDWDGDDPEECRNCGGLGGGYWADEAPNGAWLRGLERWPGASVRAALAAGKTTLPCSCCGGGHPSCRRDCLGEVEALSAIQLWLSGDSSGVEILPPPDHGGSGLLYHLRRLAIPCRKPRLLSSPSSLRTARWCCEEAARIAGAQPVREAIQAALIEWALQ